MSVYCGFGGVKRCFPSFYGFGEKMEPNEKFSITKLFIFLAGNVKWRISKRIVSCIMFAFLYKNAMILKWSVSLMFRNSEKIANRYETERCWSYLKSPFLSKSNVKRNLRFSQINNNNLMRIDAMLSIPESSTNASLWHWIVTSASKNELTCF